MAVETGTASGWLDLLDKLVTFAVANGWVVEKSVTVTAGQVEERYLRGPGSLDTAPVHVNIRTGATPVEGIYWWKVYGAIAFDTGFEIAGQPGASPGTNLILWQNNIDYWFYINDRRLIVIAKVAASYFSLYAGFFLPFANPIEYPYPLFIAATDDDPPRIYTTANSGFRSFADPGEDCAHIRTPGGQWVDVFNHGDYSTVDAYKNHEQGYYVWPYHSGGGNAGQEDSLIAWDIRPPPNYPDARIIIPLHFSGGVPEAGIIGIIDETYYVPGFDVAPEQTFSLGQSKSSGLLTLTGQPLNGETVTIDTKVYTFQAALTEVDGNVKIGSSAQESLQNLRRAINKDVGAGIDYAALTTAHPTVSAENEAGLSLPVLAKVPGAGGDSIVTTETLTNGSWGGATLSGGGTSQTYRIFQNIARNAKNHFFCIKEV
ncbi:MAG: hypothetical protein JKP98_12600 [Rhodobacteraceae bacterium]|jgi:hypothetical protein|nr:hypothetical protein [Paracoccaceae bacterium]